ncbi:MAG: phytoene desaturase family protein [Phototrophicales bacterium]|nr:phytoene desaturase family protein [Phototrophicales bacterium]
MTDKKPIIIIGAGIGGLSAAIRLAVAGERVVIIEKNAQVGGKMYQIEKDGYRWDTGPSVITMRHVFEELFRVAGRNLDDYITLLPLEPLTRYFYPDGMMFDATSNLSHMAEQIAEWDERDVAGYFRYLAYVATIHRITGPVFIYDQPPRLASFLKVPITDWLKADPLRQMQPAINGFVKSPYLRQLLGRFATYVGGSPYHAPATLNVIAHVEMTGGVWYPQGGVYTIAQALEKLAGELGVEIRTSTPITKIDVKNGVAVAVITASGERIESRAILANADVTTVYENLLPREFAEKRLNKLKRQEPSGSGFVMLLGVEGNYPQLAHHNILFSGDYRREFMSIFKQGIPADDMTIYIAITSKTDSSHAPHGHENWFVMVNAPAVSLQYDWDSQKMAYREKVLTRLGQFGIEIRDKIRSEQIITPNDLQAMSGAWRGALYGASANSKWTAFKRPHNRCADIRGLYFAGGTTHPGGGVPMVMLSGKVASEMILEDFA